MRRWRDLVRDQGGASVIEMGIAAPILATMLVGMVDLSNAYSTKLQMVQVAQRTIEKVQVRSFQESDKDALKAEAATAAGVDTSKVTIEAWLECNGAKTTFSSECSDGQAFARYVSVEVIKEHEPFFPMKTFGATADGTYIVRGKAGIRVQ